MEMKFREDLPFILNEKKLLGEGVELGVLRGDFSSHILKYWKGKRLYLVDAWTHIEGLQDVNNGDNNIQLDNLAKTFMKVYGQKERAIILRAFSEFACTMFKDEQLDFVFVDADHSYDKVKEDLINWYPKVKPGGLFCGHDYDKTERAITTKIEVKSAVDDWAKENNITVSVSGDAEFSTWYVWK